MKELKDIAYGPDASNRMDIYKPAGDGPFPAVIYIHGGGWWSGDKQFIGTDARDYLLKKGVAVVAINYRNLVAADRDRVVPPVMAPLDDTKAAYDYLVKNGSDLGLDGKRVAAYGASAGGFNALWLGLSLGASDPNGGLKAIGGIDAQTTLDPFEMRDWVSPVVNYGGHAFGLPEADFRAFLASRERLLPSIKAISPSYLVNAASPPIVLVYSQRTDSEEQEHMALVHSPKFGSGFREAARKAGHETLLLAGASDNSRQYAVFFDFLAARVLGCMETAGQADAGSQAAGACKQME